MALKMSRQAYAEMFGPTVGDRVRLADTALVHRSGKGLHGVRGRSEIRRRQSHPRRHGAGAGDSATRSPIPSSPMRSSSIIGASVKADVGLKSGAIWGDRQGRKSRHPAAGHHSDRRGDRNHRGRGNDLDRRRHRYAHPFHMPAANRGSADLRRDDDDRRRHGAGRRDERDHLHARTLAHSQHAARGRGLSR